MKKIYFFLTFISLAFFAFSTTEDVLKQVEALDKVGNYKGALKVLLDAFDKTNPEPKIIWGIGMQSFEASNILTDKKQKLELYDTAINTLKPYLDINYGEKRDRAEIIHWYAVNYALKLKSLGLLGGRESLKLVPNMFKLMDRCIEIYPEYPPAYFFKAKLYEEVPFFLGGDKNKMGISLLKALKYIQEKEKMQIFVESAKILIDRNWSVDKRANEFEKNDFSGLDTSLYKSSSDKAFATNLLLQAKEIFEGLKDPSVRDKTRYKEALELIEKAKK